MIYKLLVERGWKLMKRNHMNVLIAGLTVLVLLVVYVSPTFAAQELVGKMGNKLKRGVINVATGWVELFNQPHKVGQEEGFGAGATKGVALGIGWTVARTVVGAWDVGTFLFPLPADYASVLEPEYVF